MTDIMIFVSIKQGRVIKICHRGESVTVGCTITGKWRERERERVGSRSRWWRGLFNHDLFQYRVSVGLLSEQDSQKMLSLHKSVGESWHNAGVILGQRRGRWARIAPELCDPHQADLSWFWIAFSPWLAERWVNRCYAGPTLRQSSARVCSGYWWRCHGLLSFCRFADVTRLCIK